MFKQDISDAVIAMVELALPRGTRDKALFLPLRLSVGSMEAGTFTRHIGFFFWRPSNYTLVGTSIDDLMISRHREDEFQNSCYHDSGWRTDGVASVISEVYCAMCRKAVPKGTPRSLKTQARIVAHSVALHGVESIEFDKGDHKKTIKVIWSK